MKKNGFTLIELMLATLILAIIIPAVYAAFRTGLSAWQRAEKEGEFYDEARLAFGGISRELRSAFITEEMGFAGGQDSLSFVYALPPDRDAGYDLRGVQYSLENGCLMRREKLIPYSSSVTEFPEEIWEGIRELELSYFDGKSWNSSWQEKEELPVAVEITVYPEDRSPLYLLVDLLGGVESEE